MFAPPSPAADRRVPRSRVVVDVEAPLAALVHAVEAQVPRRVADERGRDIGIAGHLNLTADRGPFTASVADGAVLLRTEIRAHGEACARGRCYAACDPVAIATVAVPLQLTPDWKPGRSRVTIAFVRRCSVRVLGGLVQLDVTPAIEAEAEPSLRRLEGEIDRRIPSPRAHAARLWEELSRPRDLPLGGCVVVRPERIVQGPVLASSGGAHARFALEAAPEIRARCGEAPPPAPLPPLAHDPAMPDHASVAVALVSPLASLSLAPGHATVSRASPSAGPLDLELALGGDDVCGDLAVRAWPAWTEDGGALALARTELPEREAARLAGAGLDPAATAREVLGAARIAQPLNAAALRQTIPELAATLSTPDARVAAVVLDARPLSASGRDTDLVATVAVDGRVEITLPATPR